MFDATKAAAVVEAISQGASLRKAADECGVAPTTFLMWCDKNAELAERYARARVISDEAGFLSLDEISDESPPVDQYGKVDPGWIAWQRLRLDTRKWTLARKHPTKYGDKTTTAITGADGGPLQVAVNVSFVTPTPKSDA